VLIRYRAAIPLMYLLLLVQQLGSRGVGLVRPIARIGPHPGSAVVLAILAMTLVGLALSLLGKGYSAPSAPAPYGQEKLA
jgi:hypothetical protein